MKVQKNEKNKFLYIQKIILYVKNKKTWSKSGLNMFENCTTREIVSRYHQFVELRDKDIEEIRKQGKKDHFEYEEWLTMNQREAMLKECLRRLLFYEREAA